MKSKNNKNNMKIQIKISHKHHNNIIIKNLQYWNSACFKSSCLIRKAI